MLSQPGVEAGEHTLQVAPAELEALIMEHPSVQDAAVVG
jgi:acyl-coenzyme A synthetase/AMP-(fatty) acid ligase